MTSQSDDERDLIGRLRAIAPPLEARRRVLESWHKSQPASQSVQRLAPRQPRTVWLLPGWERKA